VLVRISILAIVTRGPAVVPLDDDTGVRDSVPVLPYVEPMLAGPGLPTGDLNGWAVEPKLDGWRCIVGLNRGEVVVRTRSGRRLDRTGLEQLDELDLSVVLDAELIAGEGRCEDFYKLSNRMFTRRPGGLTVMAFDLLWQDGQDLTTLPYDARRDRLEALDLAGAACVVPRYPGADWEALLGACEDNGMEGVVLKRRRSIYRPGRRTQHWRKVKCPSWADQGLRRLPGEVREQILAARASTEATQSRDA
jgi:bifunctional non-homologous end joining protein LigD